MKIGNGSLEIGMIGFSEDGELSIPQLQDLAESTLEIYPLGDIFHVSEIDIVGIPKNMGYEGTELFESDEIEKVRSTKKKVDIIAAVRKGILYSKYYFDRGYLFSKPNPIKFAHELGHVLGLYHFFDSCCEFDSLNRIHCPNYGYVMCGAEHPVLGNRGFSPEDIEKLEEWYLK